MQLYTKWFDENEEAELANFVNNNLTSSGQVQAILFVTSPFPRFVLFYYK